MKSKSLIKIAVAGLLIIGVAVGARVLKPVLFPQPIAGVWVGHMQYTDPKTGGYKDVISNGKYVLELSENGKFRDENGVASGLWKQKGHTLVMTPTEFFSKTMDQHLAYYKKRGGASANHLKFLSRNFKPYTIDIKGNNDRLFRNDDGTCYMYEHI